MALKQGATQFEQQFQPSRIGNWELPDTPGCAPRARRGSTRFIANSRGHLLACEKRSPCSPWTEFRRTDTWEGPRRLPGQHNHCRPGYQNILRAPEDRVKPGYKKRAKDAAPCKEVTGPSGQQICGCGQQPCGCGQQACGCGQQPCRCGQQACACGQQPCACGQQVCGDVQPHCAMATTDLTQQPTC